MKIYLLALGAIVLGLASAPATAQELIESYRAFLSQSNHYNSNGVRLNSAAQIIRQDRADYHRFGISDPGDGGDSYFDDPENRAVLERMIASGESDPRALRRIVSRNVTVQVDIYRDRGGDYVYVSVLD